MDDADAVGGLEQRLEQMVVMDARQGVDRIDPVGDERGDGRLGGRSSVPLAQTD